MDKTVNMRNIRRMFLHLEVENLKGNFKTDCSKFDFLWTTMKLDNLEYL